ncbi:RNHCP domain-containing protein [Streptomyces sp. NBC_01320]|uniref:RNHCP domain-containing protein n=1 Tax=Streptomyces sp. NBC_01320 TaxID=2903824 RepID=UPI002E0E3E37|nr:RNHCP domain-containing protein [Streptomyces sp. NBC_01320]
MSSTKKTLSSTPHTVLTGTFACAWCGLTVSAVAGDGTRRNHCPSCLHSLHVLDHIEGGASDCQGRMSPISIAVLRTGDWMVIHRCVRCDGLTSTPICADDNQLILMRMAVRPLAQPPFPLEAFGDL